ncbi:DUF3846 domain-containing protein [Microbacterium testaceum]|uniref:DUF3846 domain-containing protein n=1 Tax=Microbacterium testaceum TaxID=2033 RepID=UPI002AC3A6A1|nr:DUF3846 domain-containing protein [Microbacterium testaceum]MDZ5146298.1 DUF3846 domain-containing protein [Microbacterium testaceum]
MTITTWIATHIDGSTCTITTTSANCPENHSYTQAADAPGTKGLLITMAGELALAGFNRLEDYQRAVGGDIETLTLDASHDIIANAEGLRHRLPINPLGSAIAQSPLGGDIIIIGADNSSGEFVDIDQTVVDRIRRWSGA